MAYYRGSTTLFVHNCPDSVLDMHISTILCSMRGEGELEEDVSPDLVSQIRYITRLYDDYVRGLGVVSKLPNEDIIKSFVRKTWSEKRQFFYIVDDLLAYSKKDGLDCAEMEFYHSIQHSSIKITPEIREWAQEWSCGKDGKDGEDIEFVDALPKWLDKIPKKMTQYSRPFF